MVFGQAEQETGPLTAEESVGTWFSNPAASHGAAASGSGVGKYLAARVGGAKKAAAASGAAEPATNGGTGPPPAKKAKPAGYGNFSAW